VLVGIAVGYALVAVSYAVLTRGHDADRETVEHLADGAAGLGAAPPARAHDSVRS
jgi:ABC-type uncharacterized transport system permease subunit